ncbi:hypothetical protein E2F46_12145 [Luteimonas aestuarii]|uniref:Sel1 repeat family protein n=1 Tax=Luteimonas aestuarii TaxID=453837 RepID=A0A4R5TQV9_9GAMM|nr:hypothetical protein [Luteimonas aestuarii]TDK23109.1 hypothetical protein E2F46_12145 [Luteimonas aestuarii]
MAAIRHQGMLLACAILAWPTAAPAQFDLSSFDPAAMSVLAEDVVLRAPDADMDRVFKAVHAASQRDDDARALCALFEPDADRSINGLQRAANGLGDDSRQRFADALAMVAVSGFQSPRQPYDAAAAQQVVKSAGATAMFLNDGFTAGLAATGTDAASRDARCRSFRWLVDALDGFEPSDRAAATRYLLLEGLTLQRNML